ncbi:MAG: hypothetical protein PXX77_01510 [Gallionella sp.]|nr:hypothetical protein [Gallionella sp.]
MKNSKSMKVSFVGVGRCGSNIAQYLYRQDEHDFDYVCINTDDALDRINNDLQTKLRIGRAIVSGNGCEGDAELGRLAAEADRGSIKLAVGDADVVIICAGMGGGTGGGATPVIAQLALNAGAKVIVLAVMPFEFEGERPLQARVAVGNLSSEASCIEFCNDKLIEVLGGQATMEDAYIALNDWIGKASARLISRLEMGEQLWQEQNDCPFISQWKS